MGGDEAMIAAGLGFRRGCPADEIVAVLRAAERLAGVSADVLAVPAFKADEAALTGLSLVLINDVAMAAAQSGCVTAMRSGLPSVAEACALAAAGEGAVLLLPRIAHARATCALAESAA
jgi:cobalt-precorrin 5A hydrolase